jgi:transcriptional regulator NrdR family protein
MRCPECGSMEKNKVCNTRTNIDQTITKRRRECLTCGHRWTTYEMDAAEIKNLSNDNDDVNNDIARFLDD